MGRIRNEKGYALLLVMLLVVLFTIIGMGLLAMNMNAAKQFSTKEEQIQARHQSEMGVLHYKAHLKNIVKEKERQINLSCGDLKKTISSFSTDNKSGYTINNENIECVISNEIVTVGVQSIGRQGEHEEKIKAKFYISKMGSKKIEAGTIPNSTDYTDRVKVLKGDWTIPNGNYSPIESSLHITGNLSAQKGNSKGGNDILIKRNLFVDQNMDFHNHACLVTRGNLIVKGNITSKNKVYIFVYGDAYFNSYSYTSNNNQIFVSGKVFENGVEVRNKYSPVPQGTVYRYSEGSTTNKKTCTLPGSGNPGTVTTTWELDDEVNVNYFID